MKKYGLIFKMSFKENKVAVMNSILSMISCAIIILVFINLWSYIYDGNGFQVIEGYSLNNMLWYLVVCELISFTISGRYMVKGMSDDVKGGRLAYMLNKPYNYYLYSVVNNLGEIAFKFLFLVPAGILIGFLFVGPIANLSFISILCFIINYALGAFLACLIYGVIGLLAFWVEDSSPFYWIFSKLFLIFGVVFPPELFPSFISKIITYSPIYCVYSGIGKLVANFSYSSFFWLIGMQIFYIIIFLLIGLLVFKRGAKKVNVNGG